MDQAPARPWLAGLYLLGLFLLATPLLDIAAAHWPLRPQYELWRFEAAGALFGRLAAILFGVLLGCAAAFVLGHRRTLRWLSLVGWTIGLVTLVLLGDYALGFLQVRQTLAGSPNLGAFDVASARSFLLGLVGVVAAGLIGRAGWRAGVERPGTRRGSGPRRVGLVVGQRLGSSGEG